MSAPPERWRNSIVRYGDEAPDQLLAHPLNPKIHPRRQQEALSGAIGELGWIAPVVVNETTGHVIDGHARIGLAISRREASVPVAYVRLTPEQEQLALVTFDPIGAMAATDKANLDALLQEVRTDDAALRSALRGLADDNGLAWGGDPPPGAAPEAEVDRAEELREQWGTASGQLWTAGRHRLLCGDATKAEDVERLMAGERADCVFTSPPYAVGVDYGAYDDTIENLRTMLPGLARLWLEWVKPGGFAVVNFGDVAPARHIAEVDGPCEYPMALEYWPVFRAAGWVLWSRRVWVKPNARVYSPWAIQSNRAATDWEHVWTWKAPGDPIVQRVEGSQFGWRDSTRSEEVEVGKETHGAGMAPVVPQWLLPIHSHYGGVALEPFVGTGTTIVGAEQTGRRCYGMELEPKYVAVTLERLSRMGLTPRLEEGD